MAATNESLHPVDVAIVGAGLGGLTAATRLANGGLRVRIFDRARHAGGRARTEEKGEIRFNLGPHALYANGEAARTFRELGIRVDGHRPNLKDALMLDGDEAYGFPQSAPGLLVSRYFSIGERLEVGRFLARLGGLETRELDGVTVSAWLATTFKSARVATFVRALLRLSTYAADADRASAGAAIEQLKLGLSGGVLYLDRGWQQLVDGLERAVRAAGAEIVADARVESIEHGSAVDGVRLADGRFQPARAVLVAASPSVASALVDGGGDPWLRDREVSTIPVRAACLDVALEGVDSPDVDFAIGLDRPYYYSVHSQWARLAPKGVAVVHVAKYLDTAERVDAKSVGIELESLLDRLQSNWRSRCVARQLYPNLTVTHALVTAERGGLGGRTPSTVDHLPGLHLVGDWVGRTGMLADATVASANEAARAILDHGVVRFERAS